MPIERLHRNRREVTKAHEYFTYVAPGFNNAALKARLTSKHGLAASKSAAEVKAYYPEPNYLGRMLYVVLGSTGTQGSRTGWHVGLLVNLDTYPAINALVEAFRGHISSQEHPWLLVDRKGQDP